jgi:hypothetical protein
LNPALHLSIRRSCACPYRRAHLVATSWLTQRTQLLNAHREAESAKLEALYSEFIAEAARLFGDALRCDRNGPALHHGRAYAPGFRPVRGQCRRAGRGHARRDLPRANRTLREALEYAHKGGMGFLTEFGEAARIDLAARATAVR